ncbi:MAG TPA: TatD family hydrolase [Burkholderiaceae bacterium]|nr:TatD family hydrolase [Burkholderiaceae bacterium]
MSADVPLWVDTHCHVDAAEFDADRDAVVERAAARGVRVIVIPAVDVAGFGRVVDCARRHGLAYTLGIHPLYVEQAADDDLDRVEAAARDALGDPHFVGIGEIGLDFFVEGADVKRQQHFLVRQLQLAKRLDLPVVLHVRRAVDDVLRQIRHSDVRGGIAHAFNGSEEQAAAYRRAGLRLGFGGAATYDGSKRIRRLVAGLPDDAWVLETDAPDMPPQWLRDVTASPRNEPGELPRIAGEIARLRRVTPQALAEQGLRNALAALPRLRQLEAMAREGAA